MQQFAQCLNRRELAQHRASAVVNDHSRASAKRQVLSRNYHANRNQRRDQLDRLAEVAETINQNTARLFPVERGDSTVIMTPTSAASGT